MLDPWLPALQRLLSFDPARPLLFHHADFFLFYTVALLGVALIHGRERVRTWLMCFSFFVYYKIAGAFALLLVISILVDFFLARWLAAEERQGRRRALLIVSLVVNLGLLGWFKYSGLLAETITALLHTEWTLRSWALPAGISFYTFQSLSYTIDVYRRAIAPIARLRDYAFFVSLFPQLVAGPIVRASVLIPQLDTAETPHGEAVSRAMTLFMIGALKKALIADPLASLIVDPAFAEPLRFTGLELLLATYAYAVQIYADFSGYSDMAIALAAMLGFHLPLNFNRPYISASITDFWRRWHISLSSWLRDYLYVPLGGNRKGTVRTYANLMIVMLLGGMWHGAAWRFGVWGAWHGGWLALERATGWHEWVSRRKWSRWMGRLVTFHLVCFGWIFFRARTLTDGLQSLQQIASANPFAELAGVLAAHQVAVVLVAATLMIHFTPVSWKTAVPRLVHRGTPLLEAALLLALVWGAAAVQLSAAKPFIYFQF